MSATTPNSPEWKDVYRTLRTQIQRRLIEPGAQLPTISQLSKEHGLSRHGARRALERLREDGLAQSWQGRGYRVAIPLMRLKMSRARPSFHENVERAGRSSSSELVGTRSLGLPQAYAARMQRRAGLRVQLTETMRRVDGYVFALSRDYFPTDRFGHLADAIGESGSISSALAAHGVPHYERDFTTVKARMPSAHEAVVLAIPPTQPVYETVGANVDLRGNVIQVSTAVWRADCVAFEF